MSKVHDYVWSQFGERKGEFKKSEEALNQEIKEKFGYDAQLQIEEAGSYGSSNYDMWCYAVAYIDETGKLHLSTWTNETGDGVDEDWDD